MGPELILVAAVDRDGAIGIDEDVPWEYPEDVIQYRERVEGHPVIVGRRTFDRMCDPPGDSVIVVTRDGTRVSTDPSVAFVTAPDRAIALATGDDPDRVFVIGGEAIYRLYVPYATGAYVSEIPERSGGNVYFPYLGAGWEVTETIPYGRFEVIRYCNRCPEPVSDIGTDSGRRGSPIGNGDQNHP